MNRVRVALYLALAVLPLAAQPALAQGAQAQTAPPPVPYRMYLGFDVGAEIGSQTIPVSGSFPLYGETATFDAQVSINNAPIINFEGGGRVWRDFCVGLGFTWRLKSSSGSDVTASIPHPLYAGEPRKASTNVSPLENYERAIHVTAGWAFDQMGSMHLRVFGGPSFFGVKQDVVTAISVQEGSAPFNTVTISGATLTRLTEFGAVGYNVGVDGSYMFNPRVGFGILARFSGATVNLSDPSGIEMAVDAGGFDVGVGVRFRF